ncbi:hypothetical protein HDU99_010434, partial [Rhizoclosmatium hyalinum]
MTVLLSLSGITAIMLIAIQFYEQAMSAAVLNVIFFLITAGLGGVGLWWKNKLLLYTYSGVSVLWIAFCLLQMLLLLNAATIDGLSQNTGFMGNDAINYYRTTTTTSVVTTTVTSAKPTFTLKATANSTLGTIATLTAIPSATATVVDPNAVPVGGQKRGRRDDETTVTTFSASALPTASFNRTVNGTLLSTATSRNITASASATITTAAASSSIGQPIVLTLEPIIYGFHIILLLVASIFAPLIARNSESRKYDDDEEDYRNYREDRFDQEEIDTAPRRYVLEERSISSNDRSGRDVTPISNERERPPRGASNAAGSLSRGQPTTPSGTGTRKYQAGPHNAEVVPTLATRRDIYSVYTNNSSDNSRQPDNPRAPPRKDREQPPVQAPKVSPLASSPDTAKAKEAKVRCKFCEEKMTVSESKTHVCAAGGKVEATAAKPATAGKAPTTPVIAVQPPVVVAAPAPSRKPRIDSEEKLDGKKVKVVKRFVPTASDELALEIGD